jgi:hypothetical protein
VSFLVDNTKKNIIEETNTYNIQSSSYFVKNCVYRLKSAIKKKALDNIKKHKKEASLIKKQMILVENGYQEYCRMLKKKAYDVAKEEKRLFKINQNPNKILDNPYKDWTDEELLI